MEFKVLAVGDVVGSPGLDRIRRSLRYLKRKTNADFVVVNGENAAVVGITPTRRRTSWMPVPTASPWATTPGPSGTS